MFETTYKLFELVPHSMLKQWAHNFVYSVNCFDPYWGPTLPGKTPPPNDAVVRVAAFAQERTFRINIQTATWVARPKNGNPPGYYYDGWKNKFIIRWIPSKCRFDFLLPINPTKKQKKNFKSRVPSYVSPVGFYKMVHALFINHQSIYSFYNPSFPFFDPIRKKRVLLDTHLADINELMSMMYSWMSTVSNGKFNPWEIEAPEIDSSLKNDFNLFHQWVLILANYPIMRHLPYEERYVVSSFSTLALSLPYFHSFLYRVPSLCHTSLDSALNVTFGKRPDYKYRAPKSMKKLFVNTLSRVDHNLDASTIVTFFGRLAQATDYNYNQMNDILNCIHSSNIKPFSLQSFVEMRNIFSHKKICRILAEPNSVTYFNDSLMIIQALVRLGLQETFGSFSTMKEAHDRLVGIHRTVVDRIKEQDRSEYEASLSKITFSSQWYDQFDSIDSHLGSLQLIKPSCALDLDRWGSQLHCCVGSYVSRVQSGECVIVAVTNNDELVAAIEVLLPSKEIRQFLGSRNSTLQLDIVAPVYNFLLENDLIASYTGGHGVRHLADSLEGYTVKTTAHYGVHQLQIPPDWTVAQARELLVAHFHITDPIQGFVAGRLVNDDYIISCGTLIHFFKTSSKTLLPEAMPLGPEPEYAY